MMPMEQNIIVRGIGGFYDVLTPEIGLFGVS